MLFRSKDEYNTGIINLQDEKVTLIGSRGIDTTITSDQAKKLLNIDLPKYLAEAKNPIGTAAWDKLTDNQKAALVSYAYNTGSTKSLVKYGIVNYILQGDTNAVADIIQNKGIVTSKGNVLDVLVKRRKREADLFKSDSKIGRAHV